MSYQRNLQQYADHILQGIKYSVEHMSVTQWCMLGGMSVVLGYMLLRSTKHY